MAHQPSKYNTAYEFPVQQGVRGVIRYDKPQGSVTRFVVQLQHLVDVFTNQWETFAQIDHEPRNPKGHDLYQEGLHVDIYHTDGTTSTIHPRPEQSSLPTPPIVLAYACKTYLCDHVDWFLAAADNQLALSSPPDFS